MQDVTSDTLQIAFVGPALADGQMSMLALGTSLRGQALLIERAKELLYGDSVNLRVEVDHQVERGSLIIPIHILTDAVTSAEHFLAGETMTALANLLTVVGLGGVVNLYSMFKRLKGRRVEKAEDIPEDLLVEGLANLLTRVYNDQEIQNQLRRVLEPLRHEGIEEFQTRRQGRVMERVTRKDLQAADDAEIADLTKDEEIVLDIEKCAWRRNLAWHFSDGRITFDAKIEDPNFWQRIDDGEAFAGGDRLRVHLRTTAHRTSFGKIKVERVIPTVISVEHVHRQTKLFPN